MKIKTKIKFFLEKIFKKQKAKKKVLVYSESGNSYFDPSVLKIVNSDYLVISNRKNNSIDLFEIKENMLISKVSSLLFDEKLTRNNILLNRASVYKYENEYYILFTLQINGRSYIYKEKITDKIIIDKNCYLLEPEFFYENNSVMNPNVYKINNEYYLFYSSGETFEPDNICLAKFIDFKNNILKKYKFNPIFSKGIHYYNFSKVAFGDLIEMRDFLIMFYIGYENIDKAYINLAVCQKNKFPFFEDLDNINPLVGPSIKCRNAVYKPAVFEKDNCFFIYFNGRTKHQEKIFYTLIDKKVIADAINKKYFQANFKI